MIVSLNIINELDRFITPDTPEIGGILGTSDNGEGASYYAIDFGLESDEAEGYCHNDRALNMCVKQWRKYKIDLFGYFYIHHHDDYIPRDGELDYAENKLLSLPPEFDTLYIMLYLMPSRRLIGYRARKKQSRVVFTAEPVYSSNSYY